MEQGYFSDGFWWDKNRNLVYQRFSNSNRSTIFKSYYQLTPELWELLEEGAKELVPVFYRDVVLGQTENKEFVIEDDLY